MPDEKRVTIGEGAFVFTVWVIGSLCGALLMFVILGDVEDPCPPEREQLCVTVADELCPTVFRGDYTAQDAQACRTEEWRHCMSIVPLVESCRLECAGIMKSLSDKNDELWERWLACAEGEK